MTFFSSRSNTFNFVFLFIAAFAIRLFFVLYFKFDGLYGQDAYAYADWSNQFYQSVISFQIPPNFYWPIGFYLFTSLFGLFLGGNIDLAALLLSLNAGALTAGFMYLLAFELFSGTKQRKILAFISGLIICFAGTAVKSSIVIMADALGLFFLTISAYNLVIYINRQNRVNLIICFISFSCGLMTRYANGLFLAVIFIVVIYELVNQKNKKKIGIDLLIAVIAGLIVYIPQAYYLNKYGIAYFQHEGGHTAWVAAWSPLNIFRKDFFLFEGVYHYRLWNGLHYISPVFHPMFLSLFGITFLYGIYRVIIHPPVIIHPMIPSHRMNNKRIFLLLICWIAVYYLYLSGNPYQSIRYTMSFLPPLVLISVWGLGELKTRQVYKSVYISVCLLMLISYAYYDIDKLAKQKDKEFETIEWINKNVPAGAKLFTFEITGAVNHYSKRNAREFYAYKYNELVSSLDSSGNTAFIVLPVNKLKTQWRGLPPEISFDSLMVNYKPLPMGKINEFEGFKIEK